MKIVIDTNIVISAALGSNACKTAILKAFGRQHVVLEPPIITLELDRFLHKLQKKMGDNIELLDNIEAFFRAFLVSVEIKSPSKIRNISSDKPDNHFLSLAFEESALFLTGDKLAVESGKKAGILAMVPSEWNSSQ